MLQHAAAIRRYLLLLAAASFLPNHLQADAPNVLLILADDMGYGDVGVNGCQDIPTPNLDALARSGINFTAGYVTHPYCSPSRAAIMSGRHQARIGHDCNPQESHRDPTQGISATAKLLPARLQEVGYQTALIGKWHLGLPQPFGRETEGSTTSLDFFRADTAISEIHPTTKTTQSMTNDRIVAPSEITYMTTDLGKAAIKFMEQKKDQPWFCFLSYNAPHAPDQAPKEVIARFAGIADKKRRLYAALVSALDDSIGEVIASLESTGQRKETLVIFLSDNGGRHPSANNGIYRGHKGRTYEGGIRVPFMASWPGHLSSGRTFTQPVSSLDLYASIIHLAGADDPGAEGLDLMPVLTGSTEDFPLRSLFYRISGGWGWAVASPRYKLVKPGWSDQQELYDLEQDPAEKTNIIEKNPEAAKALASQYDVWNRINTPPLWSDPHKVNVAKEMRGESLN